jgi:hypothetical protein
MAITVGNPFPLSLFRLSAKRDFWPNFCGVQSFWAVALARHFRRTAEATPCFHRGTGRLMARIAQMNPAAITATRNQSNASQR